MHPRSFLGILVLLTLVAAPALALEMLQPTPDHYRLAAWDLTSRRSSGPLAELTADLEAALAAGQARPASLTAADLDGDGVQELIAGYEMGKGGLLLVLEGAEPSRRPATAGSSHSFLGPPTAAIAVDASPDWLAAGDFDADGQIDLAIAARDGAALWLPGDGGGGFAAARSWKLPGAVSALAVGEVFRADGLADLAVAVQAPDGPQALLFQSPSGALAEPPMAVPLPSAGQDLALGAFDGMPGSDLAVAAGESLVLISGRPRPSPGEARDPRARLEIDTLALPFAAAALEAGPWRGNGRRELAVMAPDGGELRLATDASDLEESWLGARATTGGEPLAGLAAKQPMILGRAFGASWAVAIPLRLNSDAVADFVALDAESGRPVGLLSVAGPGFVVMDAGDAGDLLPGDGFCDTGIGTCTLRAALEESNALAGLQIITFAIGGSAVLSPSGFLAITDPVEIDGTTQPGGVVTIDDAGSGPPVGICEVELTGGSSVLRGLSFLSSCLQISAAGSNVIEGNFFGTDPSFSTVTFGGLRVKSGDNLIGGTTVAARNYFATAPLTLASDAGSPLASGNRVFGNYFGVDASGIATLGSDSKVSVIGTPTVDNRIGGPGAGEGNVIGGCVEPLFCAALTLSGTAGSPSGTLVQGNRIGTTADGSASLIDSQGPGVSISTGAASNTIGGTSPTAGNVFGGNDTEFGDTDAVLVSSTETGNVILGNHIGVDLAGGAAVGGYEDGIHLDDAGAVTIGGSAAGAGNVISGHRDDGISVDDLSSGGVTGHRILGNWIGTNAAGTAALPNGDDGIFLEDADGVTVGGAAAGEGNVIAGNVGDGVEGFGLGLTGLTVQGNSIGTDAAGTLDLGNGGYGVQIVTGSDNLIGGTTDGAGNTIAYNGLDGVGLGALAHLGRGQRIARNAIFANDELGIDLGLNGLTPNDPGDGDAGANDLQNFPVLTLTAGGRRGPVSGTLDSAASTSFTVEIFASDTCDVSGHGEAERYLGSGTATTDAGGSASFSVALSSPISDGERLTATATDPVGNTSELSACFAATVSAAIFTDGFESGTTTAWSAAVP